MKTFQALALSIALGLLLAPAFGHEGAAHGASVASNQVAASEPVLLKSIPHPHPMMVHFPIVFLFLAPIFTALGLFLNQGHFRWTSALILAAGFLFAAVITFLYHPHTQGLSDAAAEVLEEHQDLAELTTWIALASTVFAFTGALVAKYRRLSLTLALVSSLVGAFFILQTGHHGGELVHIFGVGPQGNFLRLGR